MKILEKFEIYPFTFLIKEEDKVIKVTVTTNNVPIKYKHFEDRKEYQKAYHNLVKPNFGNIATARLMILKFLEHWSNI